MSDDDQDNRLSELLAAQPFLIETQRLFLIPLTPRQLRLWIDDLPELERELGCVCRAEPMQGEFLNIVKTQCEITLCDPDNYLFHSFWFIMRKSDRVVVGSADFKDVPDAERTVEIGYGLGTAFEHQGYMTETVDAMCTWVLNRPDITQIIAETYPNGFASQCVLTRCGFHRFERPGFENGQTYWWTKTE